MIVVGAKLVEGQEAKPFSGEIVKRVAEGFISPHHSQRGGWDAALCKLPIGVGSPQWALCPLPHRAVMTRRDQETTGRSGL